MFLHSENTVIILAVQEEKRHWLFNFQMKIKNNSFKRNIIEKESLFFLICF